MKIVHTIVNTFTAKRFIEPLILAEEEQGIDSIILIDPLNGSPLFLDSLKCKYKKSKFDLTFNPLLLIIKFLHLSFILNKIKPDMTICHMTKGAFLPLLASSMLGVKRRVYYNHGVPYIGYSSLIRFILKNIEKINCYLATEILTVNHELMPYLSCLTSKNISAINPGSISGIPNDFFCKPNASDINKLKDKYNIEKNKTVFIYVGRPYKRKGFHLLLEAFENIITESDVLPPEKKPTLLIVGCSHNDVKKILNYVPNYINIYTSIIDIHELYKCSDITVLPSYHEGFSYALLEGAASSCILLSSNIVGVNLICKEDNSIKFDLSVEAFSKALIKVCLMSDEEKVNMAYSSFSIATEFHQEKVTQNYISYLYKK